jgi:hypothetical protein
MCFWFIFRGRFGTSRTTYGTRRPGNRKIHFSFSLGSVALMVVICPRKVCAQHCDESGCPKPARSPILKMAAAESTRDIGKKQSQSRESHKIEGLEKTLAFTA